MRENEFIRNKSLKNQPQEFRKQQLENVLPYLFTNLAIKCSHQRASVNFVEANGEVTTKRKENWLAGVTAIKFQILNGLELKIVCDSFGWECP